MKTFEQTITAFDKQLERMIDRKWRRGCLEQPMLDEVLKIRKYLDRAKAKLPEESTEAVRNEVYKDENPN